VVLWRGSPLKSRIKRAAAAAGIVHFFFSFSADVLLVASGAYVYNMHGLFLDVPADLHIAWAGLWGAGFCLVWERLRGWKRLALYAAVVMLTFGWDLAIVSYSGIVAHPDFVLAVMPSVPLFKRSPLEPWWKWDLALLAALPLATVSWFWLVKENKALWLRSLVYAVLYAVAFYLLFPGFIEEYQPGLIRFKYTLQEKFDDWEFSIFGLYTRLNLLPRLLIGLLTLLGAWAAWVLLRKGAGTPLPLDPTRKLVTTGPYAYVRNPMQLSGVGVAIVLAVVFESWYLAFYALDLVIILLFMNVWEKEELARTFGEPYVRYAASVRNWLPRLRRYDSSSSPS
jgi:protein-S-isoprenylcysteine O-methyltransferase Ste14